MPANTIDTGNYRIGGAALYFCSTVADGRLEVTHSGDLGVDANSFGNIVTSEISPEYTQIDHWVASKGRRVKDKSVLNTTALSVNFTWDEMNQNNLAKFFVGTSSASKISVLQNTLDEGCARLVIETDIGQDMTYYIPKCVIRPDGALTTTVEDWHSAAMVLEVLEYIDGDNAGVAGDSTFIASWNTIWVANPFGRVDTAHIS